MFALMIYKNNHELTPDEFGISWLVKPDILVSSELSAKFVVAASRQPKGRRYKLLVDRNKQDSHAYLLLLRIIYTQWKERNLIK